MMAELAREALLRRAALGGTLVLGGGLTGAATAGSARSTRSRSQDIDILNFALVIEELQASFYAHAARALKLKGELRQFVDVVGRHERQHAAFVRKALGAHARRPPRFTFTGAFDSPRALLDSAVTLEDIGLAAYNGQAPNLTAATLAAAARIVSVEARHAAWIRDLAGKNPAPFAADKPATTAQVTAALNRTGFVRLA
jgi:rubrerythrin